MKTKTAWIIVTVVIWTLFLGRIAQVSHQRYTARKAVEASQLAEQQKTAVTKDAELLEERSKNARLCTFIKSTLATTKSTPAVKVPAECLQACPAANGQTILGDCKETNI